MVTESPGTLWVSVTHIWATGGEGSGPCVGVFSLLGLSLQKAAKPESD